MPNHTTNILKINADKRYVREILETVKNDKFGLGSLDFNKIIPMPEELNIEESSITKQALNYYKAFRRESEVFLQTGEITAEMLERYAEQRSIRIEVMKMGEQLYNNIQNHGAATWYDWSIANYGSKWNSYGYNDMPEYDGGDTIRFLTANGNATNIVQKLSDMFPDAEFEYRWADEDFGMNVGEAAYMGGECIEQNAPSGGSKEAYELAADIMDMDLTGEDAEWMLSADGSTYVCMYNDDFDLVYVQGKPMMFTEESITTADIPLGMYLYKFDKMEGSVISKEPVEVDDNNCITFDAPDEDLNFTDEYISLKCYCSGNFDVDQSMGMNM